ncbi:MAG TPA: histidine kinase [Chloroflexota bacterium]|nr:histidine kinase [Chloroflexota bacterium]
MPRWVPPVVAIAAASFALMDVLLEDRACNCPTELARVNVVAVHGSLAAFTALVWLAETVGQRWSPLFRLPRPLFLLAAAVPVSIHVTLGGDLFNPLFLLLLAAWMAFTETGWYRGASLAIALLALVPGVLLTNHQEPLVWLPWALGIVLAWLFAYALAVQQRLLATQQRLLTDLRAAQVTLAEQAAADERRRIAREVHDVVAHSLAVTMLHLTGARHILKRSPERAADALMEAERLGRQALGDIRRTVGLLQPAAADGTATPLPNVADLPALVNDFSRAGLEVRLTQVGDPQRLSSATGLGLYRIAQEALTNVVKHAPGAAAEVELLVDERASILTVRSALPTAIDNSPAGPSDGDSTSQMISGGNGIPGMRERAVLLGGMLEAEPRGGEWVVTSHVPLQPAESSAPSLAEPVTVH